MKREIVHIDEEKCDGCGLCIPNCHEGALQLIDGKARLISDLLCDGLGACIGHCPQEAITIEKREAEAYDEIVVMKDLINKGQNTVKAHLKHLKEHNELEYLKQGVGYLKANEKEINFSVYETIKEVHNVKIKDNNEIQQEQIQVNPIACGCPGSKEMNFAPKNLETTTETVDTPSQLAQWPVQMHLVNPRASYFINSDLLLSADCVAYSLGNFHQQHLKGKSLAIACPKLDSNMEIYVEKLTSLIDDANINTMTVMKMEVPCCGGLVQMAQMAREKAERNVPIKVQTVGIQGEILDDQWI
ncbi:ATP-binding protein [Bacteroidota bacterium]